MITLCAKADNRSFLVFPMNQGVSADAKRIQDQIADIIKSPEQSETIGGHIRETKQLLDKATEECFADNWDAYGAKAIDETSYRDAIHFTWLLPPTIPVPEIYIDPDGEVNFEWYAGPRQVFSVSIGSNNELAYAGLFGANKTHGTEYLDDELPGMILDNIRRVFSR